MTINELTKIIEACLFASGDPVSADKLAQITGVDEKTIDNAVTVLNDRLEEYDSALEVLRLEGEYQLCTKKEYAPKIRSLLEIRRNTPLSQAALEVLSIVAYNQPVTKSLIEQIRGVDSYYVINSLCEKGLIMEAERLQIPGRPLTYVTTSHFLRSFSLNSLNDLTPVESIEADSDEEISEEKDEE